MGLAVLVLILGIGGIADAQAGIRIKATWHTPDVRVQIKGPSSGHHHPYRWGRLPARHHSYFRVSERDRKIARRLAWYTDVPARELIRLRRHGYRWAEIGRWLELPRPVVRAAMHRQSWQRFLRQQRHLTGCGDGRILRSRVVHRGCYLGDD
jgi:hypothetical protein